MYVLLFTPALDFCIPAIERSGFHAIGDPIDAPKSSRSTFSSIYLLQISAKQQGLWTQGQHLPFSRTFFVSATKQNVTHWD